MISMLGLFCDTFCILEVSTLSAVVLLLVLTLHQGCWHAPDQWNLCYRRSGCALSLRSEDGSALGIQKTNRETVHTFCRRFHLSPTFCSVRIQQWQLCDICHPLVTGHSGIEKQKTTSLETTESYTLVENVVWRLVLSAGKDSVSFYVWSLMFFSSFNMEKKPQSLGTRIV